MFCVKSKHLEKLKPFYVFFPLFISCFNIVAFYYEPLQLCNHVTQWAPKLTPYKLALLWLHKWMVKSKPYRYCVVTFNRVFNFQWQPFHSKLKPNHCNRTMVICLGLLKRVSYDQNVTVYRFPHLQCRNFNGKLDKIKFRLKKKLLFLHKLQEKDSSNWFSKDNDSVYGICTFKTFKTG